MCKHTHLCSSSDLRYFMMVCCGGQVHERRSCRLHGDNFNSRCCASGDRTRRGPGRPGAMARHAGGRAPRTTGIQRDGPPGNGVLRHPLPDGLRGTSHPNGDRSSDHTTGHLLRPRRRGRSPILPASTRGVVVPALMRCRGNHSRHLPERIAPLFSACAVFGARTRREGTWEGIGGEKARRGDLKCV